jgi:hypothetical protein
MELYYIRLADVYVDAMNSNFQRIVEGIFIEFEVMVIGVCCLDPLDIVINPTQKDLGVYPNFKAFLAKYNTAVVFASDQHQADNIERMLSNSTSVQNIINKIETAETIFPCSHIGKTKPVPIRHTSRQLKFLTRNVIAPFQSTARKFSKQSRVSNISAKNTLEMAKDIKHKDSEKTEENPIIEEEEVISSDDETEEGYVGIRSARILSTLPDVKQRGSVGLSRFKITLQKTLKDAVTVESGSSMLPKVESFQDMHNNAGSEQSNNQLMKTLSSEQLMNAIKRKSEPPPSTQPILNTCDTPSAKRKSAPSQTGNSSGNALESEDDLLFNSPRKLKPNALKGVFSE